MQDEMPVLLTDFDPAICAWLRQLVADGLLAGEVRQADIREIAPEELRSYRRVQFFAGIGGRELALRLAGWPEDLPVWTGSCPCQPFSVAGKRKGADDERHLWPAFRALIAECRPPIIFGEQVASNLGRSWLSAVRSDLERLGYAVGAADLPAASVGAPHPRQRLWWGAVHMDDAASVGQEWRRRNEREDGGLGDTDGPRSQGLGISRQRACQWPAWTAGVAWLGRAEWWPCGDNKVRPFESGIPPVADGVPGRVVLILGAGNAIVPQVAAAFVTAFMEAAAETFGERT